MSTRDKKNETHERGDKGNILEGISCKDLEVMRRLFEETENNLQKLKHLVLTQDIKKRSDVLDNYEGDEGKIIEGIFDGEFMIAKDGKKYPIPPNYSSKSKLVSGDVLKLTVKNDGSFLFKQIGPTERKKIIGELKQSNDRFFVQSEGKNYNVLLASVTYFKIKAGDKLTIIVPMHGESDWAAIENIIETSKKAE